MNPHIHPLVGWLIGWWVWLVGLSVSHDLIKGWQGSYTSNAPFVALFLLFLYCLANLQANQTRSNDLYIYSGPIPIR